MKGISLRILFAIVLSLMCILFGAGNIVSNGITVVAAHVEERTSEAVLEQEFKIKYGQELTAKGEDLKVMFASVQDSRCPIDAKCHWAGDAKILIRVRRPNVEESQIELHTYLRPQEVKYQEYVIRLVTLYPRRRVRVEVKPSDYVATLLIKKD
jgi:hypothetical protein